MILFDHKKSFKIIVLFKMGVRDHYTDFVQLLPDIKKNLSCPVIVIHANPASYGKIYVN